MMIGIGVIVLVLIGGLFFLNKGGSGSGGSRAAVSSTQPVVVALQAIPQGTTLMAGQPLNTFFTTEQVPPSLVPFGAYTSVSQIDNVLKSAGCNPAGVAGCRGQVTTTQTIYQKMPVVSGMFSTLGQYRTQAGPAFQIPYGYVAQTISLSAANSVQGAIQPGDDIDIIASLTSLENTGANSSNVPKQTQYALNDIRVIGINGPPPAPPTISANGKTSSSSSASTAPATDTTSGGSLTVLVRYQQALIIQHMKDFGGTWSMSVVLRSSKETDIPHFRTLPVFGNWFFTKQDNHFDYKSPY